MAEAQTSVRMDVHVNGFEASPVTIAFDELATAITNVQDEVSVLIDKIHPALGPDLPMPTSEDKSAMPAEPSEIVRTLNRETERLRGLVEILNVTRHRIEL